MAKTKYAVELKAGNKDGSFMAGQKAVELTEDNPRFETTDAAVYEDVRRLPFVKDLGKVKAQKASEEKAEG